MVTSGLARPEDAATSVVKRPMTGLRSTSSESHESRENTRAAPPQLELGPLHPAFRGTSGQGARWRPARPAATTRRRRENAPAFQGHHRTSTTVNHMLGHETLRGNPTSLSAGSDHDHGGTKAETGDGDLESPHTGRK